MVATSETVVAIGPTVSNDSQSGNTPSTGIRPQLGLKPTTPQHDAGRRIEQPVSVPIPMSQRPAASAAAFPPDDPPVVRARMARVLHRPVPRVLAGHAPRELVQVRLADHDRAGATSRSTALAVRVGTWSA